MLPFIRTLVFTCGLLTLPTGASVAQSGSAKGTQVTHAVVQSCKERVASQRRLNRQAQLRMSSECLPPTKELIRYERESCKRKAGKVHANVVSTCKWLKNYLLSTAKKIHHESRMPHASGGGMDHMYGYVDMTLLEDGSGTVSVMFSNGARLVGGRFRVIVDLLATDGKPLQTLKFEKNIGMAGFHGAVERRLSKAITLSETERPQFQEMRATYCVDGIGDINGSSLLSSSDKKQICAGWTDPAREPPAK